MYLCNCNGVTKREAEEAIAAGAQRPEEVLAHHGCEPCCGRCLPDIADEIAGCNGGGVARTGSLVAAR
jgi:bacterioferritin-associated ferredoxin